LFLIMPTFYQLLIQQFLYAFCNVTRSLSHFLPVNTTCRFFYFFNFFSSWEASVSILGCLLTAPLSCYIVLLKFSLTAFNQPLARCQWPLLRVSPVGGVMATSHKTKNTNFQIEIESNK
jgi:hypothetical protein